MVLLLCTVCLCYACVVDMGLRFRTVLCGLCGSSVVGVAGGCELSLGLFRGVVVGWALSFALLCALVYIDFWYILLSVSMSGESWYTTKIFKPQSHFSRLGMLTELSKLFEVLG